MMHNLKKLKRNFDSVILMLVGMASVFLSIKSIDKLEGITLFSVGLLCISIAIERFFKLEGIEKSLNELKERVATIAPTEIIEGKKRIYEVAEELIKDARSVIRATSFGEKETAPDNYFRAVAKKLQESKVRGKFVEYRVVMSSKKRNSPSESRRRKFFDEKGVSDLFSPRYVDITWGLDVLIVDSEHLLVAFPELSADESLQRGIVFKNKPELVNSIREWYDNCLWNYAREQ